MLNFTVVALKIWAYSPKIAEIGYFGINLPLMENPGVDRKT